MIYRDSIGFAAVALIWMSACGGKSAQSDATSGSGSQGEGAADSSTAGQGGGTSTGEPAACAWPASLDPADSSSGQCVAARMYLACKGSNGDTEECLSNDPSQCPVASPVVGVTFSGCTDMCNEDEYAVACGGAGPGPWPSPPAGCRGLPSGPGGGSVACCPCGEDESLEDSGSDALTVTDDDGGTFACGTSTCDGRSQVCEHVEGGAPPGVDFYACIPIPAACDDDVSCACVTTALRGRGAGACSSVGSDLTVEIDVP